MSQLSHLLLFASIVASCISYSIGHLTNETLPKSRSGPGYEHHVGKWKHCAILPPDYPQERFNRMFESGKVIPQPALVLPADDVLSRTEGDPFKTDDCDSVVSHETLYRVKTKKGWQTVVQAPDFNYVQRFRFETCTKPMGACFTTVPIPTRFKTFCKQKYSVWELLVDDGAGGTEKVKTKLPTSCVCQFKTVA